MANLSATRRASALLFSGTRATLRQERNAATKSQRVEVSQNDSNGITTISLSRAPINSLSLNFLIDIREALEEAVENKSKGVILTSSLPKVFSAGLDLRELLKPNAKRVNEFWNSFQDLWLTLYGLKIPVAAAINGSSPAAGCLMAMSCEYRVMVNGEHMIGMNATMFGILVPKFVQDTMVATIGQRRTEQALISSSLFNPDEALSIGLIDELASDKADAVAKCQKFLEEYASIPSEARAATKMNLRGEALEWLQKYREFDRKAFLDSLLQSKVQKHLYDYLKPKIK